MNYSEFLANKKLVDIPTGFSIDPKELNPKLMDFQHDCVIWSLKRGRAALFEDCGLGKTVQQLEWANQIHKKTNKPILILAPLSVTKQTRAEGRKFRISVNICESQDDVVNGINISNYEKIHKFDSSSFSGIVLDECFPPETKIDVFNVDKSLSMKYIKDIRLGDCVFNSTGEDYVKNIYKRKISRAVKLKINSEWIICSENHPFFTMYGWRSAQDLQSNDFIMETRTAMCLVRGDIQAEIDCPKNAKILREILFSEMEDVNPGTQNESLHENSEQKKSVISIEMEKKFRSQSACGNEKDYGIESNAEYGNSQEGFIDIAEDGAQTFRAWGQWSSDDITTAINDGCSFRKLDTGICYITGKTETEFSNLLQSRLRKSRLENSNRNRREFSPPQEGTRSEERSYAGFSRVESIEILEQGHPELEKYRDAEGNIYFYDIKATRHPSFSVNGLLVHNSSCLKSYTSKYRSLLIDLFRNTPYKLCCTATPSPNDFMELGNHAEFLNIMTRSEMLSMFFINDTGDTGTWRLKKHAVNDFWEWMCSWSVLIQKPSDLGYDDNGFILPEIIFHEHIIQSNLKKRGLGIYQTEAKTLEERREAKKESLPMRVAKAAEIVNESSQQWGIWCNLNTEGDALAKVIPTAIQVQGSDTNDHKVNTALGFVRGNPRDIISKGSIYGFGMNWQHCFNVMFVGLSDSYEQYYQIIRRFWRFGQKDVVHVHIITSSAEGAIVKNIKAKEKKAQEMISGMLSAMSPISAKNIKGAQQEITSYDPKNKMEFPSWLK